MFAAARPAALALALGALLLLTPRGAGAGHPPDLEAEGDCDAWVGTFEGNDPDMRISMRLCPAGTDAVKGRIQTSSLKSGYSVRDLEGSWRDGRRKLEAHDTRMVESHPNPGWVFCTVDSYELELKSADELTGTVIAIECHDRSKATLKRVPKPTAAASAVPRVPSAVPPVESARSSPRTTPSKDETDPPRRPGGCGCHVAPKSESWGLVAVAIGALCMALRKLRRR